MLEILAQEQAALLIGGHGKDQPVLDRHLMIRSEIQRRAQRIERGVRNIERIRPSQNDGSRLRRRIAGRADKYAVTLAQC